MKITVEMDIKEFEDYMLFRDRVNEENKIIACKIYRILKELEDDNPENTDVKVITNIIRQGLK